ncbi:MAG TPA: glycosyltransferase family 2 protein [Anaerolineae bacterium]|nr:glycosyltransferase family 2 protein [Anaerolineae bacterium]
MTQLSLVIPAYNEENGILDIIQRILDVQDDLKKVDVTLTELLVVDDGSKDKTAKLTQEISVKHPVVRLVEHPQNKGYGAALKTGFEMAKGDLVGFLDADGTYPPEYFPQLCTAALQGADLVIGSRMSGSDSQMPTTRYIGNRFFATLLSYISGRHVTDSASGMRIFKRNILKQLYPLPDGLNLTPVMSTRALHESINIIEVPIPYSERVGNSKLSVVRDGSIFLQSMLWTAMMYNPVRILGFAGLAGIAVALLAVILVVLARLQGITTITGWGLAGLFGATVAGGVGANLFFLGVVFNYLVTFFHNTPIRQGLWGTPLRIEKRFGLLGTISLIAGLLLGAVTTSLGLNGWALTRLWLYFVSSTLLILAGTQLIIFWIIIQILDELKKRQLTL